MARRHHPTVWVLLADGEHARVVCPTVSKGQFATLEAFDSTLAHLRATDLGGARPGRVQESADAARHAVEPRQDPHQQAKHDFVADLARQVSDQVAAQSVDRLVLVAPARALHDLRQGLSPAAAALVVGSLDKDLLKVPDRDLGAHLAEWWVAPPAD